MIDRAITRGKIPKCKMKKKKNVFVYCATGVAATIHCRVYWLGDFVFILVQASKRASNYFPWCSKTLVKQAIKVFQGTTFLDECHQFLQRKSRCSGTQLSHFWLSLVLLQFWIFGFTILNQLLSVYKTSITIIIIIIIIIFIISILTLNTTL